MPLKAPTSILVIRLSDMSLSRLGCMNQGVTAREHGKQEDEVDQRTHSPRQNLRDLIVAQGSM